ncbi:MAG: peptidoglycan DD-metalloendopeptidase family protein [Oligoflexales bacterium]|nr:peptidoglycan DD-metalloendopeptidase family protein [Oligoflexales bacterium]
MRKRNYRRSGIPALIIGIGIAVLIWSAANYYMTSNNNASRITEDQQANTQPNPDPSNPEAYDTSEFDIDNLEEPPTLSGPVIHTEEYIVKKNSTVYDTLRNAGISPAQIHAIITASAGVFDLSKVRSGIKVLIQHHGDEKVLNNIGFLLSATDTLWVHKLEDSWTAKVESKPVTMKIAAFKGDVNYSLWQSAVEAGLDAQAIFLLSEIFAWQIDFEREVRPGDYWRILIERTYVDDKAYGWGNIIAAEYQRGEENYRAVRYPQDAVDGEYYTPLGDNLKGKFLKSPLRYSRISSKFQRKRFHPILGVNRPHLGVDYAAPRGTPVRAVGDGKITLIGRRGGNGKMIKIRHNAVYETAYKHLNNYAKGLKRGGKVSQGQIIGFVGSTGLATGPHLHFEFYENGKFTDPLGRKFPREDPVPPSDQEAFVALAASLFEQIDKEMPDPRSLRMANEAEIKSQS